MAIQVIYNPKGGVGKTTTALNLATISAKFCKTLYIDLDANRSGTLLSGATTLPDYDENKTSSLMFCDEPQKPSELAIKTAHGFDIVPAGHDMANAETWLSTAVGGLMHLAFLFDDDSGLESYERIFLDCAGWAGSINNSALFASENALIPLEPSQASADQLSSILKTLNTIRKFQHQCAREALSILGFFFVKMDVRTNASRKVIESVLENETVANCLVDIAIPRSTNAEDAGIARRPVVEYMPNSNVAEAYVELFNSLYK